MSNTGVSTIDATNVNLTYNLRLGRTLDPGSVGQVVVSGGRDAAVAWGTNSASLLNPLTMGTNLSLTSGNPSFDGSIADTIDATDTDTTYTAGNGMNLSGTVFSTDNDGITINNSGGSGTQNQVLKVPNTLTINGSAYDGSAVVSITTPDTQLTLAETSPITISSVGLVRTIGVDYDDDTIVLDGGELAVDHVPYELTINGSVYDGSSALSITTPNTTYSAGDNINIGGPGNSISVNQTMTNSTSFAFKDNGTATTLIGSNYPSKPTVCTYLDLTDASNILPAATAVSPFLGTKIQETYIVRSFSTTYAEYSSNFRMSFVAQSANALVEFQGVIAAYSKIFYGALYDYNLSKFWTVPQTQTRFKYDNGVDQDPTTLYWYLTGLTAGTTYYISPYFKSSAAYSYVYAGNSGTANQFAPGIFRVSDGGSNVSVY
jgi:hypothetical protein